MSRSVWRPCLSSLLVCTSVGGALFAAGTAFGQALPAVVAKAEAPPPQAFLAAVTPEVRDSVLAAIHVRRCDLLILPVDFTPGLPLSVSLPTDIGLITLDLGPYSVRSDRFALYEQRDDGLVHQVKPPVENTLRGVIRGHGQSVVAGGVMPDGLSARIIVDDEREYWIEAVSARVPGAPEGLHALYTRDDLALGQQWRCGGPELRQPNPDEVLNTPPEETNLRGATLWTAVMDADADWEFFQDYGGTGAVTSRIQLVTNTMNLQYERDVNIRHTVGTVIVRATSADPYTTTDPAVFNTQLETEWSSGNRPGTSDVVQMFTGKELDGSIIGRANQIGSICLDGDSNCLSQSDFNGNFMSATDLSAHELGHLWDAVHCTCSGPASTMNPSITAINRFTFSNNQNTIAQINGYRATRGCLTTSTPGTAAPNDSCANADPIGEGFFGFENNNATTDGPTPTTCGSGNSIQEDVWYSFLAPCNGTMTLNTCGSNYDTVLAVYTGSCGALSEVACNDDNAACGSGSLQSAVSVSVTFNTRYLIRIGGWNGANGAGLLTLGMTGCPAPANNACSAAITIDHCSPVAFSTVGATTDGPLEPATCNFFGYQQVGSDIWYRYTAACTGSVQVSLCDSTYDTKLAVYTSCGGLAIACNDDFCGLRSQIEFPATVGTSYLFRIGGFNNSQGSGTISVTNLACPIPSNDTCAGALTVSTGSSGFSTLGACSDGFTSTQCSNDGGNIPRDVWYRWTSPGCAGQVTIDTCTATYDTKLAVYTTCPAGNNTTIACNDDAGCGTSGLGSRVMFANTPGTVYLIRVGGYNNQSGTGTLTVAFAQTPGGPSNDACASATPVFGGQTYISTLCGATNDGTASCGASATNPDVWFAYTATCTGPITFTTCGTHDGFFGLDQGVDSVLSVHTGSCGALSQIGCNDDTSTCAADTSVRRDSSVTIDAVAGLTYRIRVSKFGANPVTGPVRLNVGSCSGPQFCDADWCQDGSVGVPDIFCFLSAWFANDPVARNYGGTNGVPAIFAFLSIWFATGTGPCTP